MLELPFSSSKFTQTLALISLQVAREAHGVDSRDRLEDGEKEERFRARSKSAGAI